jgi:putative serine protease PepD
MKPRIRPLPIVLVLLAIAFAFALGNATRLHAEDPAASAQGGGLAASTQRGAAQAGALGLQSAFVNVYKSVSPSVVQIETNEGLGSGIVFDGKGDIVTNAHVVGSAKTFRVTTQAGKTLRARLVGTFVQNDLAVIRVRGGTASAARFANSDDLRVGDIALAIGNPLGLQSSFTQGVVSALGRDESEGNGVTLRNSIQTSAAINPGNSGGALVDIRGRVIGIPTLAASDPQMGGAAPGIGFAIPSNDVRDYANQMITHGRVVDSHRAYLGIRIGQTSVGVYVGAITANGPSARAGIHVGDVITAVNGRPTRTVDALGAALADRNPGQTVKLSIVRSNGTRTTAKVTLGQLPGS